MKTRITMRALGALLGLAMFAGTASADTVDCQRTIGKETQKFLANKSKTLAKCEQDKIKGKLPPGEDCSANADAVAKIDKFMDKMEAKIVQKCGEPDVNLSFLGGVCPDLEGLGCDNVIADAQDAADCFVCLAMEAADQVNRVTHANLTAPSSADAVCEGDGTTKCKVGADCAVDPDDEGPLEAPGGRCVPSGKAVTKCQQTISKETQKFLAAKSKELSKCWDLRLKGKHSDVCPDENADPKSTAGKAAAKIAKAMATMNDKICKACGGSDKACGGTDGVGNANDILPSDIGVDPAGCPDVTVPGGGSCSTDFTTTQQVVDCLVCVDMFKADCLAAATYPSEFGAYPSVCNAESQPTCTSADIAIEVTVGAGAVGLDVIVDYPGTKLELFPPVLVDGSQPGGTFLFGDNDTAPLDGLNDQLTAGLVSIPGPIVSGGFADAVFNCRAGAEGPTDGEFSCTADASDILGQPVSATCSVVLNVTP